MADELEMAFLEGRMSVNDEGGLAVLIQDPDEEDTYYKLNMTSRDGTMSVWAEGADGDGRGAARGPRSARSSARDSGTRTRTSSLAVRGVNEPTHDLAGNRAPAFTRAPRVQG